MKKDSALDLGTKGYKSLLLQIFNVKHFVASIGGGIFIFSTAYLNNQWDKAQILFWSWVIGETIWLLFLIVTYKSELWLRIFLSIFSVVKKAFPLIVLLTSLYFILFPFDLKRAISLSVLAFAFWTLVKSKPMLKERRPKSPPKKNLRKGDKSKIPLVKELEGWTATETDNEQSADYREINLEGKPLKTLEFKVKPFSTFWRAGFKITDPNGGVLPLRTRNSLLFHLGSTDLKSKFGLTAYLNGDWISYLSKTLDYDSQSSIAIRFEVNSKNLIRCLINGHIEFELKGRIDPEFLKKVFVVAWGDGHPYRVDFNDIQYSTR